MIPAAEAYGGRSDDHVVTVDRAELPDTLEPTVGQQLQMSQGGQTFRVTIAEVGDNNVILDANHPLAGKDLTFDLTLVSIQ